MDKNEWIKVTEQLPTEEDADESGNVLTYDNTGMQESFTWNEIEPWNKTHSTQITHWKNSPPPEGE